MEWYLLGICFTLQYQYFLKIQYLDNISTILPASNLAKLHLGLILYSTVYRDPHTGFTVDHERSMRGVLSYNIGGKVLSVRKMLVYLLVEIGRVGTGARPEPDASGTVPVGGSRGRLVRDEAREHVSCRHVVVAAAAASGRCCPLPQRPLKHAENCCCTQLRPTLQATRERATTQTTCPLGN